MEEMLKFSAEHNILPDCENYEWEDWPTAFKKCETGTARYRCVVNCENHAKKLGLPQ
jgi:D-arabinose 1-dehydrogenase-like Zn-dependent alcohol dehydrogenase